MTRITSKDQSIMIDRLIKCLENIDIVLDTSRKVIYDDNATEEQFRQATFNTIQSIGSISNQARHDVCRIINRGGR